MKVISLKHMPTRLPIVSTLVWWMFLDRFPLPGWAWGVAGTLAGIIWVIAIYAVCKQEQTDVVFDRKEA